MTGAPILLDTSAIFAAADRRERHHAEAGAAFRDLLAGHNRLFTTDLILAEIHALTLSRLGPARALALLELLLESARVHVLVVASEHRDQAVRLLRERPDRQISLTDAVSFVVMRENAIETAFTLDSDFSAEGFRTPPATG